ncbi:hypothetical protein DXC97_27640 [Lachnospiraceae bacterium TF09-5]|nr:hypothetical protein DXC97_27640 [Lachnospiraceae bacterium TF09-5]
MKKYLFLDRGIFNGRYMTNAKVELASIQKEGAVFFREDFFADPPRKWEVRYDNGYPNVLYDSKEKIYRCYYTLFIHDRDSENTPLKERAAKTYVPGSDRVTALCYACSTDGIHWEKPELGLVDFKGNKRNNILYAYVHGTGVFLDEEELDPKRRYKLVTKVDYAPGCGYMAVGFSADGIHFGELKKWTGGQPRADTHNFVFREERTGRFVLITRIWKNGQRIAARCESSDFLNWTEPQEIFRGRGFEDQIYSMPVFRYNDIYLGVPSVYHEGDTADKDYDTVDLRLAWSVDTLDWEEVAFGENFMDRGKGTYPDGEFDCGCIYSSAPVPIGDRLYFYYMGGNGRHTDYRETSFSRGYIPKDCFAYYRQKDPMREAVLSANPFFFRSSRLEFLTERGRSGSILAELTDESGRICLTGKTGDTGTEPEGNAGSGEPRWETVLWDGTIPEEGKIYTLRIRFSDVFLYGMRGDMEAAGNK